MSSAQKIVDALLEGEEDFSAFNDAAIGATLSAWTQEDPHSRNHLWTCPTVVGRHQAEFSFIIHINDVEGAPGREAISLMADLNVTNVGGPNGHWFGFTFASPDAERHVLTSVYRATLEMTPKLKKPVSWSFRSGKAVPSDRLDYMKATVIRHVMTPEAKALGVTYFTGSPKVE